MAIGSAVERGAQIFVYDENGLMLFAKPKGSGPQDGLLGFTGSTVIARYGAIIYYDERGQPMPGSALVRDPKFQERVVTETRALLSKVPNK